VSELSNAYVAEKLAAGARCLIRRAHKRIKLSSDGGKNGSLSGGSRAAAFGGLAQECLRWPSGHNGSDLIADPASMM